MKSYLQDLNTKIEYGESYSIKIKKSTTPQFDKVNDSQDYFASCLSNLMKKTPKKANYYSK